MKYDLEFHDVLECVEEHIRVSVLGSVHYSAWLSVKESIWDPIMDSIKEAFSDMMAVMRYDSLSISMPIPIGTYTIADTFSFSVYKKQNWLHRKMMKLMLGITWKDKEDK